MAESLTLDVEFAVLSAHCRICGVRLDCCHGFAGEEKRDLAMKFFTAQHKSHSLYYDVIIHAPGHDDIRGELELIGPVQ